MSDEALMRSNVSRLIGMRTSRYSWWVHGRELADYLLPRRYRWLITPNQASRGSPINQHILDSTGTIAARNLASGMVSGISSPTRPWLKLKVGNIDSTGTNPISLWLAEVERRLMLVFQMSNFYTSIATAYYDLVVFGTCAMMIYEDSKNVINCVNSCYGEYYIDVDNKYRPCVFYREFTMTISAVVEEFGIENCSGTVRKLYEQGGAGLTREIIVAHAVEPNEGEGRFGNWEYRETYWEWGGSTSPQSGGLTAKFLRKRGYNERPCMIIRWDITGNDPYGRSPGMDALPDVKQLQLEVRRKAQGIDKGVNPPMLADGQLKNQPASLLPGGFTYINGMMATGHDGMRPAYGSWKPDIAAISEDLQEIRERIKEIFFNNLFQTISQFETRSNVSATEIDARKAESLILLGPVLQRIHGEGLDVAIDRTYGIMDRRGLIPPPPAEISDAPINVEYVSILAQAQQAAAATGIERTLGLAGNLAALDPSVMDKINVDFTIDKYSTLMSNDPRCMRSEEEVAQIRKMRQEQQAQQQQAEMAEKMAAAGKNLAGIEVGGGQNAVQAMLGGP